MRFKNKKILITAGPTWVAIDSVRVISNIATGESGLLLAEKLQNLGAHVTLLLGPTGVCCLNKKIKLIRFRFFAELKDKVIKLLKARKFDIVIHTAAVSDYQPVKNYNYKISQEKKNFNLKLKPTEKIINLIKKIRPSSFLVGYKFEPRSRKEKIIAQGKRLLKKARCDLVVGNSIDKNSYLAYIISRQDVTKALKTKEDLANNLIKRL